MKKKSEMTGRRTVKSVLLMTAVILLMLAVLSTASFAVQKKQVTVAYIDYNDFITPAGNGTYSGYAADYLQRISEYTDWNYKFVDMDWAEAYQAVKDGSVDLYCVARLTEDRQSSFDFSLYPICNEEMNLYTLPESKLYYEDYRSFDGMKIGMLEQSGEIDYFEQYAERNGFDYELVQYSMNETAIKALKTGEVDAIALVNYSVDEELKLIGNFGVSPAYMMGSDGSTYISELSRAQERLYFDDPDFTQELEKKYYGESRLDSELMLTRDEVDYIAAAEPMTVAVSVDMAPIEYYDEKTDSYRGVTVDLYKKISELTGLEFNFIRRENAQSLLSQMKKGEVQLIGAMAQDAKVAETLNIKQSKPFSESTFSIVAKNMDAISKDGIVAVPAGYPMFSNTANQQGYKNLKEYDTLDGCISAVYTGEADLTYTISMCEGYLLDHVQYSELNSMILNDTNYNICFGVTEAKKNKLLLPIINKSIDVISDREISEMIVGNTSYAEPKDTFVDTFIKNGAVFIVIGLIIIAGAIFITIQILRARQQRALNSKIKQHHDFLQQLYDTVPCGIFQYSYEKPHSILNYNAACIKIYGYDEDVSLAGEQPAMVVKEDTEDGFQAKFDLCEQRQAPIMYTWPITRADGSEAYTECVMDIVETEQGKVFQEIFIDVTERMVQEKKIEKRYMKELNRSEKKDEGLLYTACLNITEKTLVQSDIDIEGIKAGIKIDDFLLLLKPIMRGLQSELWLNDFCERFSAERMERAYEDGHYEDSIKFCRRKDEHIQWIRTDFILRQHPTTGDLMCFMYIWDITDDQVTSEVMRCMAFNDCECFMSIDMTTGHCLQYAVDNPEDLSKSEALYGQTDIIKQMTEQMSEQNAEELLRNTALSSITECLTGKVNYQVYATLSDAKGVRRDKALTYFYTDEKNGFLAMTVTDVTEVRRSEVHHAELLADALTAAEKADVAKSQFLSSVSHEMRTPLNAIIGFIELAKGAEKEEMANYLASSDIAAKQLLSVINDVLDMSSIESGKIKIAHAPFNFKHLIHSITNIYGIQCRQKGIEFETKIKTPTEDWLIGDELRVNQILMNLLGNAVKFTSEGHIWLTIEQTDINDDKISVRFEISDTGCGMSREMQERLFKPFEQESATVARKYGGSGLGLSIVKNLVDLMDGTVLADSKQDEGTRFIVDIPFTKRKTPPQIDSLKKIERLHVLAVDDEKNEREYMSLVFRRMGVRFSCVGSGSEALVELENAEKQNDPYNVCLIDWRMPEMSGVDTTLNIRQKYGEDVVVIVVSAYDFQQAEDNAREAGANLFVSKPIFQSSMFDLFMTLTGGAVANLKENMKSWDFAGKRVLVAEDNILNQVVVKGYLDKCNVICDIAENGKRTVEKFIASKPSYYDAILMDIQMPEMDGFEATRAIRACDHPQAKTIPIIAQTADAFDEDIVKALSAGMNAHVAKPIEHELLMTALREAFKEE